MRNRESSSGRGRGRGRYNNSGGRGRSESAGRTYYNNSAPMKTHTTKPKAKLDDAKFDIGPVATRAIEYEKNQRFLLNYIQRTHKGGEDIVTSLEEKKHVDFDKLKPNPKTTQT
jgi:hypothetical protein